jgi:outer membrane receptor protein involved in Fe transport
VRKPDDDERLRRSIEEVVVTAQKREEKLQDVPISVAVFGGEDLDRLTTQGLTEVLNTLPGVTGTSVGILGGSMLTVRGVNGGVLFGGSNSVGYYLDTVPFGMVRNGIVPDTDVYDLERVEVLRGPQGTLYGASSQMGVVRILTHPADLEQKEIKGRASLSSTSKGGENYRGDMAVNVPIIEDKLAMRAVLGYQDLSGWIDSPRGDDVNDAEIKNARLRFDAQPTEKLSMGLSAWLSRSDFGANSLSSLSDPFRKFGVFDFDEPVFSDSDVFGLRLGYDFENFSVTSTSGYLSYVSQEKVGQSYLPPEVFLTTRLESDVFSQEITLHSTSKGPWKWTLGVMYRDGEDRLLQEISDESFRLDFGQASQSLAVYGELTRLLADGRFELTAGLRYFTDDVGDTENQLTTGGSPPLISRDDTFDEVSPRVVLSWNASDEAIVYGSYSEGFRSGFNQWALITRTAPEFPSVKPDTIANYEIGTKGSLFGGRIQFDMATYFVEWKDRIQGLLVNYDPDGDGDGLPVNTFVNATGASGLGLDLSVAADIGAGLTLGATFGWNDLTVDDDILIGDTLLVSKGDRMNESPQYTGGLWANCAFPIGSGGYKGVFAVSANYVGNMEARAISSPGQVSALDGDSMLTGRASVSLQSAKNWAATLFVDNVTNEDGIPRTVDLFNPDGQVRIRPRTVGLMFDFKY